MHAFRLDFGKDIYGFKQYFYGQNVRGIITHIEFLSIYWLGYIGINIGGL